MCQNLKQNFCKMTLESIQSHYQHKLNEKVEDLKVLDLIVLMMGFHPHHGV